MTLFGKILGWIVSLLFALVVVGQVLNITGLFAYRSETFYLDLSLSLMMLGASLAGALVFNPLLFKRLPLAKGPVTRILMGVAIVVLAALVGLLAGDFVVGPLV